MVFIGAFHEIGMLSNFVKKVWCTEAIKNKKKFYCFKLYFLAWTWYIKVQKHNHFDGTGSWKDDTYATGFAFHPWKATGSIPRPCTDARRHRMRVHDRAGAVQHFVSSTTRKLWKQLVHKVFFFFLRQNQQRQDAVAPHGSCEDIATKASAARRQGYIKTSGKAHRRLR